MSMNSDSQNIGADAKKFEFRGNAKEWFGIWIVNLLLSIVTIGIYSAWAKVRSKKYFYNNTFVDGRNFDYHATGKQILIGRIIVVVGYVAFNLLLTLSPALGAVLAIGILILMPWLIVRSMMFNARMSSFSNVRFRFHGKYGRAFFVFVALPILFYIGIGLVVFAGGYLGFESGNMVVGVVFILLAIALLFIAFPVIDRMAKAFSIDNHTLGTAAFSINTTVGPFIKAGAWAAAWAISVFVIGGVLFSSVFSEMFEAFGRSTSGQNPFELLGFMGVLYLYLFVAILPAGFIYQAIVRNVVYNNTALAGGHRFQSNVKARKMLWIAVSNMVVVICSLFLMLPWAQVRLAKYLADHTYLLPGSSLDEFIGTQMDESGAVGDAFSDLEGIDVGLPL